MPDISIITATYNSAATLAETLQSVSGQGEAIEQIIVDGGSTDHTLEIARSFPQIEKILSEPDRGLYDAMNKGIALASGEIIGILNSDDLYAHHKVLEQVAAVMSDPAVDSCYGDLVYVAPEDTSRIIRYWRAGSFDKKSFYWGWMPPHPTFFVRRSVYERYGPFRLEMGSAADYELMLRFLVKYGITSSYIPEILVRMRTGGVSNAALKNRLQANRMDCRAWEVNGLRPYPWTTFLKPLRKIPQYLAPFRKGL